MIAAESFHIDYVAEPTLARFHASDTFVRGVRGPVGSGKSVGMVLEILGRALRQAPHEGLRRTRWVAIRNTSHELETTTLKTWLEWVPETVAPVRRSVPITARLRLQNIGDSTGVDAEVLFLALDRPFDTRKLRSLEATGVWLNEASELPKEVLDMATQRVGRFPPKRWGGPTWNGVILDTNPPGDDHWWYRLAEEEQPENFRFFSQPPALLEVGPQHYVINSLAENVQHQPKGAAYWLDQVPGKSRQWIRVFLQGQYGSSQEGRPVYPEFREDLHLAKVALKPYRGLPLRLGWDFGMYPACVIAQVSPRGKLLVLDELTAEGKGIRQFSREVVRPHLANHYAGLEHRSVTDPAGTARVATDARSCLMELEDAGFMPEEAPTNALIPRREAVTGFLTKLVDGEPGLLVSPTCKWLLRGFRGAYAFERVQVFEERYRDEPKKTHPVSDVHDCLQYIALDIQGGVSLGRPAPILRRPMYEPADAVSGY